MAATHPNPVSHSRHPSLALDRSTAQPLITFMVAAGVYAFPGQRYERSPQAAARPIERTRGELRDTRSET